MHEVLEHWFSDKLNDVISIFEWILFYCAVLENIHTPPQKGLEFPGGGAGLPLQFRVAVWLQ